MKNSANLLLPSPKPKWPLVALIIVSLIGFVDATFLTVKHYTGGVIPCSILDGCDTVTNSVYSNIAGIPVALLGALFYLAILLLALAYLQNSKKELLNLAWFLSLVAFLASLAFVYLQVFVIKSLCLYCLISATTSTLLFVLLSWWQTKESAYPA